MKLDIKFDYFLIFIIYLFTHGFLLLNRGLFWDDWITYHMDPQVQLSVYSQAGSFLNSGAYIHIFFSSIGDGILSYRVAVFLSYLIISCLLYSIIRQIEIIPRLFRLFIVLLFIVLPMNSARISLICLPYALNLMLFFIGFWAIIQYYNLKENKIYYILAIITFFLSFFAFSTFFIYLIPLGYVIYHEVIQNKLKNNTTVFKIQIVFLFLLPVFFVFLKKVFYEPYGYYQGYNEVSIDNLWLIPNYLSRYCENNIVGTIKVLIPNTPFHFLIILIVGLTLFYLLNYYYQEIDEISLKNLIILFIFGIFLFILAAFPYILAGLISSYTEWNSRHQLLIPFGLAVIIVSSLYLLLPNKNRNLFLSMIVITCMIATQLNYIDFQRDWIKQEAIMDYMKSDSSFRFNTTFIIKDNIPEYNANQRTYRSYEYTGWMKHTFGDETRLAAPTKNDLEVFTKYISPDYNCGSYKVKVPDSNVSINKGSFNLDSPLTVLYIQWLEITDASKYKSIIKNVVQIKTTPYTS